MGERHTDKRQVSDDVIPGLIDPPGEFAPLPEWLAYRAELDRLDWPGLAPYKASADRNIARLREIARSCI